MEELLNSIDGVTVIREIEGRVADLAQAYGDLILVKILTILIFVILALGSIYLFTGGVVYILERHYSGIIRIVFAVGMGLVTFVLARDTFAVFPEYEAEALETYTIPPRYEIFISDDADRATLAQYFEVYSENELTVIVEPRSSASEEELRLVQGAENEKEKYFSADAN